MASYHFHLHHGGPILLRHLRPGYLPSSGRQHLNGKKKLSDAGGKLGHKVYTSNLNVIRGLDKVRASNSTIRDNTRPMVGLSIGDSMNYSYTSGKIVKAYIPVCTMPLQYAVNGSSIFSTSERWRLRRTSVFPMTESGPGLGGAQKHQSSMAFTREKKSTRASGDSPALTPGSLTVRRLVVGIRTLVGASLALF